MGDEPEPTGPKQDGRFQPGQSGNPAGRPKGALNEATRLVQALMAGDAEAVFSTVIDKAKAGDMVAARLVVERLAPIIRTGSIKIELQRITSLEDIPLALRTVIEAVAAGALSLDDGERLAALIDRQRIALEQPDLELRLKELEHLVREMGLAQMVGPRSEHRPNGRDD
jgi:uncharacterized protein DUF5681